MLSGYNAGSYVLFSSLQREYGPRLYDPFFGFAYMGKNSQIRVVLLKNNAILEDLTPAPSLSVSDLSWKYFSRNLTTLTNVPFAWPIYTTWQVKDITAVVRTVGPSYVISGGPHIYKSIESK